MTQYLKDDIDVWKPLIVNDMQVALDALLLFENFIDCGACNAELMRNISCTNTFLMKFQNSMPVYSALAAEFDAFKLRILPAFISAFKNSLAFGLGYS